MNIHPTLATIAQSAHLFRLLETLEDIEYRRVTSAEDFQQVAELRRLAFLDKQIFVQEDYPITDLTDFDRESYVFSVHWMEQMVASIRINIISRNNRLSNTISYFPDVLNPLLDQGMTFMDPTRFSILPGMEREIPGLNIIVLRLGLAAVRHFRCDFGLAMIREGHVGFYRKIFNYTQIAPFQKFDTVHRKYGLFSTPRSMTETVCQNYPVLDGLPLEWRMLFDPVAPGEPKVLTVKPTARQACGLDLTSLRQLGKSA